MVEGAVHSCGYLEFLGRHRGDTRWRAWPRDGPVPRPLVERSLHAAKVRRKRRVEQELLARIQLPD